MLKASSEWHQHLLRVRRMDLAGWRQSIDEAGETGSGKTGVRENTSCSGATDIWPNKPCNYFIYLLDLNTHSMNYFSIVLSKREASPNNDFIRIQSFK